MVDILLLLSARYATSRATLGTIDMLHPPPAGLLCSSYLNDGSGLIAVSCKLVPIEDSSSTVWESFNVEADMAPSYEICADESLVLSAEKYADAPESRSIAAEMRGSSRVLSADFFHDRNSSVTVALP